MTELKACPFCGGKAKVSLMLANYCITCTSCMGCIFPAIGQTREGAIAAWNRREEFPEVKKADLGRGYRDYWRIKE